jgi:hypothetical protein
LDGADFTNSGSGAWNTAGWLFDSNPWDWNSGAPHLHWEFE